MLKMSKKGHPRKAVTSAEEIAEKASRGEDISAYFTNQFTAVRPVRRVNVDLTPGMLRQLDERAARLNISRQAVIKTLLERALEQTPAQRAKRKAG
ncbi:MAG TPA: ribbon-helix-helix protein, CopG family [Bryobacteraceae bacterium]|nr:ribbon-helix-helix protein, CopG family [Bryobacteraceae bacterium]